jgi:hypothetical protein
MAVWARKTFPDAHIIAFLDESRYQALANPALLGLELRSCRPTESSCSMKSSASLRFSTKSTARSKAPRRSVLLGSSARRLKTADRNLLAGRPALRTMYPLVPAELGADSNLARVLRFGSIPVTGRPTIRARRTETMCGCYVREVGATKTWPANRS